MDCLLCDEHFDTDMLDHLRLMHPEVSDELAAAAIRDGRLELLKPVTQRMHDDDHVCERCDKQFQLGMTYGEQFEGFFGDMPIVGLVCGDCFMEV